MLFERLFYQGEEPLKHDFLYPYLQQLEVATLQDTLVDRVHEL